MSPPRSKSGLPARMRKRIRGDRVFYYYDTGGKPRREIALGSDFALALQKYAEYEIAPPDLASNAITFDYVADRYAKEVMPTKAPGTQRKNHYELIKLREFFNDPTPAPLDAIKPIHVRQYLDWRRDAPHPANREVSLLSHIWNKARGWGYTDLANPCAGVERHQEPGRDVYLEDEAYKALLAAADAPLRDAIELAYLTGQRPGDILKISETDIRDGALHFKQAKTGAKVRIAITGELASLVDRIIKRKRSQKGVQALALIVDERGQPLGYEGLRKRFAKARDTAGIATDAVQFRDLRAKAGTDKAETSGAYEAQKQLGHTSVVMTEDYIRDRRGALVKPTK